MNQLAVLSGKRELLAVQGGNGGVPCTATHEFSFHEYGDDEMDQLNRLVGELAAEVRGLRRDTRDDRQAAAEYRHGMREELQKIVLRQTHIENDLLSMKNKVDGMEKVTVTTTTLLTKAQGAGTLGIWLLRIGVGVVTVAGWIVGALAWFSRPPS